MQQPLDLDPLKDRRKVHRLDIFHLAVNSLITLPIPDYLYQSNVLLDLFLLSLSLKLIAIMIIIFTAFFFFKERQRE